MTWITKDKHLHREFVFQNFAGALEFVNQVAELAEAADHHPDILIYDYKKVRLTLFTHHAGMITQQDHDLAQQIDQIS